VRAEERTAFGQTVRRLEREARAEQGYGAEVQLDRTTQAAVNRLALRRALVAHGLLRYTSREQPGTP
jgi:hypothetical protein